MGSTLVFVLLVCITGSESFHQSLPSKLTGPDMGNVVKELKSEMSEMKSAMDKYAKGQEANAKVLKSLQEDTDDQLRRLKAGNNPLDGTKGHSLQHQLDELAEAVSVNNINLKGQEKELKDLGKVDGSQNMLLQQLLMKSQEEERRKKLEERRKQLAALPAWMKHDTNHFKNYYNHGFIIRGGMTDEQIQRKMQAYNKGRAEHDQVHFSEGEDEQMMEQRILVRQAKQSDPLKEVCDAASHKGYRYNKEAQFCYKYFAEKLNFEDARDTCDDDDGDLAKVDTQKKMDIIRKLEKDDTYLGATDEDEDGVWKWVVDDSIIDNFKQKGSKNCLEMVFGKLDAADCTSKQHFVCELQDNQLYDEA